jgi:hypothetical protein
MTHFTKIATPALAALALFASVGTAFAAPVFSTVAPGNGMAIEALKSELLVFNGSELTDLLSAKTVGVIKYDSAWTDGDDYRDAVNLLTDDSQSINQLREALRANPAAEKLLAEHKIAINDVVDIISDGAGNVTIYVS